MNLDQTGVHKDFKRKYGLVRKFVLPQSNAPKYMANLTMEFLAKEKTKLLPGVETFPDINPIGNLWFELEKSDQQEYIFEDTTEGRNGRISSENVTKQTCGIDEET